MTTIFVTPVDDHELPAEHYQTTVQCNNCDHAQTLVAPKGVLIEKATRGLHCVKCGCVNELRKKPFELSRAN